MFTTVAIISWVLVMLFSIILLGFNLLKILMGNTEGFKSIIEFGDKNLLGIKLFGETNSTLVSLILPILLGIISVIMILLSFFELLRLRKKQKISKPFIKIFMIISIIITLLTGTLISITFSSAILIALIMLEVILFDSESINNYAEERNLIDIYREEKKFEREVNKQGKVNWNKKFGKGSPKRMKKFNSKWGGKTKF